MASAPKPAVELTAADLAKSFGARFLENGNYDALEGSTGRIASNAFAQTAALDVVNEAFEEEAGFSGLAVQSVGYTAGAETEKVVIYVARGSKKDLSALPTQLDGIEIVTRVMGKLRAGPAPAMASGGVSNFFEHDGRIACGSSCAPSGERYSGTLGAFVSDGTRQFALSNNHVLAACNHTPVGMPIASPSNSDARAGRRAPTAFALYERMIELRSGDPALVTPSQVDAAIAAVTDPGLISSWQGGTDGYDTPAQTVAPQAGMKVKKVGRTTGLTTGVIEAFQPTPWILPYKSDKFTARVWCTDTWTIRSDDADPFALQGDSGSLIVTEDGTSAVGLLFAVNSAGMYGIFVALDEVLAALGSLQLLSGHGLQ